MAHHKHTAVFSFPMWHTERTVNKFFWGRCTLSHKTSSTPCLISYHRHYPTTYCICNHMFHHKPNTTRCRGPQSFLYIFLEAGRGETAPPKLYGDSDPFGRCYGRHTKRRGTAVLFFYKFYNAGIVILHGFRTHLIITKFVTLYHHGRRQVIYIQCYL
jgi:hypothetical protein